MTDPLNASVQIDLPADKALRLECLRLADDRHVGMLGETRTPADEVVARARVYADFVLTETRGSSNG